MEERTRMPVTPRDFFNWLWKQGIDHRDVKQCEFVPEGVRSEGQTYMRVTRYIRNLKGNRFLDESARGRGEQPTAAEETVWVPLGSLPTSATLKAKGRIRRVA